MTAAEMYAEIMDVLIETPRDGFFDPFSALWTTQEIMDTLSNTESTFTHLTHFNIVDDATGTATANTGEADLPSETILLIGVEVETEDGFAAICSGSQQEATIFAGVEPVELPAFYTVDTSILQSLVLVPPPEDALDIQYTIVANPDALPSPPDLTEFTVPSDFQPFIKYGALASIFNKSGPTFDPIRAAICDSLFQLGVETAKSWMYGSNERL